MDTEIAEAVAPPEVVDGGCAHCNRVRPIMLEMEPGRDGKPWRLCSGCYLDGIRPMNQIGPDKVEREPTVLSSAMGDALEKCGWKVERVPAPPPPSSKRKPRKATG